MVLSSSRPSHFFSDPIWSDVPRLTLPHIHHCCLVPEQKRYVAPTNLLMTVWIQRYIYDSSAVSYFTINLHQQQQAFWGNEEEEKNMIGRRSILHSLIGCWIPTRSHCILLVWREQIEDRCSLIATKYSERASTMRLPEVRRKKGRLRGMTRTTKTKERTAIQFLQEETDESSETFLLLTSFAKWSSFKADDY